MQTRKARGQKMRYENDFCIYWSGNVCQLEQISLDVRGVCQECIFVELEEFFLKEQREKLRRRVEDLERNDHQ